MKNSPASRFSPVPLALLRISGISVCVAVMFGCSGGGETDNSDARIDFGDSSGSATSTFEEGSNADRLSGIHSLDDVATLKGGFAKRAALHSLLGRASEKEAFDLLKASAQLPGGNQRQWVESAIVRRLAATNPGQTLKQIESMPRHRHESLITTTFSEWSQWNLDDAVASAKKLELPQMNAALVGILSARDDLSEDLRRQIARQLNNEQLAIDLIAQAKIKESIDDPAQAWHMLVNDDQDNTSQAGLLIQVAQAWFDDQGFAALSQILDSLTDWSDFSLVLTGMMPRLLQSDPHQALEQILGLKNEQRSWIANMLVSKWAQSDPQSALDAVSAIEGNRLRKQLQEAVVRAWANKDPRAVLDGIELLPENLQKTGQEAAIMAIAQSSPEEAANLLATLDNQSRSMVAYTIASQWANRNPTAALDWVLTSPDVEHMRNELLGIVLGQVAEVDPQLAFETALNQPIGEHGTGLESTVLARIAMNDPELAVELLAKVRDGNTKLMAYMSVGSQLVRQDRVDQAMKLAQELSGDLRDAYYQSVLSSWGHTDPEGLYESLARLPSDKTKSRAALALVRNNQWSNALSEEQVEHAKGYLSEEDKKSLEHSSSFMTFRGSPGVVFHSVNSVVGGDIGAEVGAALEAAVSEVSAQVNSIVITKSEESSSSKSDDDEE